MPFICHKVIVQDNPNVIANSVTVFQKTSNVEVVSSNTAPTDKLEKPKSSYLKDMINLD